MIFKILSILIFVFLCFQTEGFTQSINSIKKEKEKSEKQISYLNKLLNEAMKNKSASTEKVNILQQKVLQSKKLLSSLNEEVKYIQHHISINESRIEELQKNKHSMLDLYAKLVYGNCKKRNKADKLMFIFSSADFNQAYNRYKYFQQIQDYSQRQLELIHQVNDSLNQKNQDLKRLVSQKDSTLREIGERNKELEQEQRNESRYISELQKKEKEIRKKLQLEMQNRQKLSKELNRLITKQIKASGSSSSTYKLTPEEKLVSDDFSKNRGHLPWPVAEGFVSEKFGVHAHPIHKRVEVVNDGINITTSRNADVRSVFKGVISEVWYQKELNYVIIIRHGNYLTAYSNLVDVVVQKGQKVNTKDKLGKVAYDPDKGSVLNFQVRKDIEILNPELWLAK